MATITTSSTANLTSEFAQRAYMMYQQTNGLASDTNQLAKAAQEYLSTGAVDGLTTVSKTASKLKFSYTGEEGDSGTETVTGTGLTSTGTAQVWKGNVSTGKWSNTDSGSSGTDNSSKTLTYTPADTTAKMTLTKYTITSTETGAGLKINEGYSYAGTMVIDPNADGAYTSTVKSFSSNWKKVTTGTLETTFAVTSKAGATSTAGEFDTVNFTGKDTVSTTKVNDSYVSKVANSELSSVLKSMLLNGYGVTYDEETQDSPQFTSEQLTAIGRAMMSGNDTITGTANADSLSGYAGKDKITGGAGADVFIFAAGDSGITSTTLDTVTDFKSVQGDKIQLNGLSTKVYAEGTTAVASFDAAKTAADALMATGKNVVFEFDKKGGYLFVDMDGNGTSDLAIALTGVKAAASFGDADVVIA